MFKELISGLTFTDVLMAAAIALLLSWLIRMITSLFMAVINRSSEYEFSLKNRDEVIERCHEMFPTDHILFDGKTFRRGMSVCVVTLREKKYEGCFIGVNNENMLCLLTDRSVVAQELDTVVNILPRESKAV